MLRYHFSPNHICCSLYALMMDFSKIEFLSPFVFFFFAHLGAFPKSSSGHHPTVGLFIPKDCVFRPILTGLCPLLSQSLHWHQLLCKMSIEGRVDPGVRSSDMDIRSSSSDELVEMEVDTGASKPLSCKPLSSPGVRAFHACKVKHSLDENALISFRDRF